MPAFAVKKHVRADVATVFAYASDLTNAPKRIRGIVRLEVLTPGPIGKGTRFRETRVMFKREATEEMEITEFDPPRGYSVSCHNHGCHYRSRFQFAAKGDGTDIEMLFEVIPKRFLAKVMSVLMRPMLKMCAKEMIKDLEDLTASIETEQRAVTT